MGEALEKAEGDGGNQRLSDHFPRHQRSCLVVTVRVWNEVYKLITMFIHEDNLII
jgi:hypothetical protein